MKLTRLDDGFGVGLEARAAHVIGRAWRRGLHSSCRRGRERGMKQTGVAGDSACERERELERGNHGV